MAKLGFDFTTWFVKHTKKYIFSRDFYEKSTNMQKLFQNRPLSGIEKQGYISEIFEIFEDTSSIFDGEMDTVTLLVDQLIKFIRLQNELVNFDIPKLEDRLLPNKETGRYKEPTETENLFIEFSSVIVKEIRNFEQEKLEELLKKQEVVDPKEGKRDWDLHEDGKLILVRMSGPGAPYGYISAEEIRRVQGDLKKQAQLFARLFKKRTEQGEVVYTFTAGWVSALGLQQAVWDKKRIIIEEMLKNVGFDLDPKGFKVDRTGRVSGNITDKKSDKLRIETSLAEPAKAGERLYKFTFISGQSFYLKENQIKTYFKDLKLTANQAFLRERAKRKITALKVPKGKVRLLRPLVKPVAKPKKEPQPPAERPLVPKGTKIIVQMPKPKQKPKQEETRQIQYIEGEPGELATERKIGYGGGVMGAKQAFEERVGFEGPQQPQDIVSRPPKGKRFPVPPVLQPKQPKIYSQLLKYYAVPFGSFGSALLFSSLFG